MQHWHQCSAAKFANDRFQEVRGYKVSRVPIVPVNRTPIRVERELFLRLSEVLHYLWDPCGVCREPRARDAYEPYLNALLELVMCQAASREIADYLTRVCVQELQSVPDVDRDLVIAELLLDWSESLVEVYETSEIIDDVPVPDPSI